MRFCSLLARLFVSPRIVAREDSGIAAIEFAFIAPLLILLFVCITDVGLGVYANMQVNSAAQYGSQYALMNGYNTKAIRSAVRSASNLGGIVVTPKTFCGCPSSNGVVQAPDCSANCSDGSQTGTFVSVSVSHTYTTLLPYPGLPSSFPLAAQSTMRLQ